MKTKSILLALGVMATLVLGNGATAEAQSTETDKKAETVTEAPAAEPTEITVTVNKGDTLDKIAKAHNTTYVRLFNANPSIIHPDQIDVGDQIIVPTADKEFEDRFSQLAPVAAPVAPKASAAQKTTTTKKYTKAPVSSRSYYVGNGMWCTDYVYSKRPDVPIYGNAGYSWISAAKADGKATGTTPQAGAIAVMNGHVAYVDHVNADGTYVVSEMGWNYKAGNFNQRTVKPGAFGGFIY